MDWIFDNLYNIGIILGALDIVFGALPDKIIKWPGIILSIGHQLHQYGKEQRDILK
ncbi:unnamed protein product [marine sediment metagenome]|uniref:Uncharacterized protein n=1 Tax=marine sediment metagenome TaxID=412755 RepID=X0V3Z9_9ZZZZ